MFKVAAVALLALVASQANGQASSPDWATSLSRAKAMVAQMTNEEKNNLTYGYSSTTNGCSGNSGSVPRLGFPGFCLNDAENGVRASELVNAYAAGVHAGASWNLALANQRGLWMGREFKAKGVNVALGPVVAPLGRLATNGRNWEGFGSDPYLAGMFSATTLQGMQQSVIASVKHFVAYEQELNRNPEGPVMSVSSNVDDQDMHELYLWPFQDSVYAGAACVMCSYNRINETYACENPESLNGLLKGELAFPGFVLSDWGGQHSGVSSASAGLDMAMPNSPFWENGNLSVAVQNGSLASSRLDDMVSRIVAAWYQISEDKDFPPNGVGMAPNYDAPHTLVDGRDPASKPSRLQSALEGHVLVKNTNNALPLKKPKLLSLYGYDATVAPVNYPPDGPYGVWNYGYQAINATFDALVGILLGTAPSAPETATLGTLTVGGGSGANTAAYFDDPYSAMVQQAYEDDTFLSWDFQSISPSVNPESDACLVFINEFATEGYDRSGLADPTSDMLVGNIASKCKNTIVVIHNAGIRLVNSWIDNPNVTALVYAHLPGQDSGRALVQLLYGQVSPSGRLPYTVARDAYDYGPNLYARGPSPSDPDSPQSNFSYPNDFDYRYFQRNNLTPQYWFGYGLTYSTFSYANLNASWISASPPLSPPAPTTTVPGGVASLFDSVAEVALTIKNTGSVVAAEVPQLYIQYPGESGHVLRGFAKETLQPGESKNVTMTLRRKDLSKWDVVSQQWLLQTGTYGVLVGASFNDTRLTGSLVR